MGKLIVIEGTDGSGKSTQFRLLSQHLETEKPPTGRLRLLTVLFPQMGDQPMDELNILLFQSCYTDGCGGVDP